MNVTIPTGLNASHLARHTDVDWLIVGGGIHGVHIAACLIGEAGVDPERIRVVDPGARLLERWRACTATTGMTHLRSPSVHHLDVSPWSLRRFAGNARTRKRGTFAPPYDRPKLSLFNDHCDRVIEKFGVERLHLRARATTSTIECDRVLVGLSTGTTLSTTNLVLAIGASEQPHWPAWAPTDDPRVQHIFEPDFDSWPQDPEEITIVGGGISAAQVALRLLKERHEVQLVSRHALRQHQFDSDPGWLGPRFMEGFRRERDVNRRRALIAEARHQGSVPPDIQRALRRAIARSRIRWHEGDVDGFDPRGDRMEMKLSTGATIQTQHVFLATGFAAQRPGGPFVDQMVESASLPCARCGYPIVDPSLRWHPRVYVSGPLAELELGPVSRNIAGARRAAARLVEVARARCSTSRVRP